MKSVPAGWLLLASAIAVACGVSTRDDESGEGDGDAGAGSGARATGGSFSNGGKDQHAGGDHQGGSEQRGGAPGEAGFGGARNITGGAGGDTQAGGAAGAGGVPSHGGWSGEGGSVVVPGQCLADANFEPTSEAQGGAGHGGAAGAGGAHDAWCEPDSNEPTSGAGGESGAGGASEAGAPSTGPARALIDDLEDGDEYTAFVLNGRGGWYISNDGSGEQYPSPCVVPSRIPGGRGASEFAMHSYGRGFTPVVGGFSNIGMYLRSSADGAACTAPLDASAYSGVEFWAKGPGVVRFFVNTVATTPLSDYGSCVSGCYDAHGFMIALGAEWTLVRVPFELLLQEGWGAYAPFDRSQILTLNWSAKAHPNLITPASCFDFWIDDVAFYSE